MSNVKVNGNTYSGVTSVRLPLADGTGYATYAEGAVADSFLDNAIAGVYGDIYDERSGELNLGFLSYAEAGTVNFPNITALTGSPARGVFENLLFPKAASLEYKATTPDVINNFAQVAISGTLDLSGITGNAGNNGLFMKATIGTLKLGSIKPHNNMFIYAQITNLIWNNTDTTADAMGGAQGLNNANASITNAYVPDDFYDDIKELMDAGSLAGVTNLYKISEWSGD